MPTLEESFNKYTNQEPKLSLEESYRKRAPLVEEAETGLGMAETAMRGATNVLGLGDEIRAGLGALYAAPFVDDKSIGELYDEALESERLKTDVQREANPAISIGSEIVGSIPVGAGIYKGVSKLVPKNVSSFLSAFGTGKGKAMEAASSFVKAGAVGGAGAAAYGFGEGEGGFEERLDNAIDVGLFGAALSGPLGALSPSIKRGGKALLEKAAYLPTSRIISRGYDKARQLLGKEPTDSAKVAGYNRASEYLQELIDNPEELAKRLDEDLGGMTTAQYLDDTGLLALQENLRVNNPQLANKLDDLTEQVRTKQATQLERLEEMGDTQKTRDYLEGRLGAISDEIEGRIRMAADETEAKIAKMGGELTEEEASRLARNEIEAAYQAVKAKEDRLWAAVPKEVSVPWKEAKNKFIEINSNKGNVGILPDYVNRLMGKQGAWATKEVPVKELHTISSRLKDDARSAMADGKASNARIYRDLAKALDDDISSQQGKRKGNVGELYDTAVAYSAMKNDKFSKGVVGKLRGVTKAGGERVPADLTLKTALGTGGIKGKVQYEELLKAADTPAMRDSVQNYMLIDMQKKLVDGNKISVKKAEKYLRDNESLLNKFPEMKQGLVDATKNSLRQGIAEARQKAFSSNVRVSRAQQFLDSPVDEEFRKMLTDKNPVKYADQLVRQMRKDKSGEAIKGLQSSVFKYVADQALTAKRELSGSFITQGDIILDLIKGRGSQANKKASVALKKILTPAQVSNLERLAIEMRKVEPGRKLKSLEEIGQSKPSVLTDLFAKVTGARLGAQLAPGGGSIQTAAIGSGFFSKLTKSLSQDQAKELLEEALFDPKLMKALLTNKNNSKEIIARNEKILEDWYKNFVLGQNLAIIEKYGIEEE